MALGVIDHFARPTQDIRHNRLNKNITKETLVLSEGNRNQFPNTVSYTELMIVSTKSVFSLAQEKRSNTETDRQTEHKPFIYYSKSESIGKQL